ncbi:MAG: hypothetical protein IH627_23970 [Rubrivivax sp.]|nr:hypothetical protein [Rubrivivax sp.]
MRHLSTGRTRSTLSHLEGTRDDSFDLTPPCVVHDLDLLPRLAERAIALRHGIVLADVAVTGHTPAQLKGMLT